MTCSSLTYASFSNIIHYRSVEITTFALRYIFFANKRNSQSNGIGITIADGVLQPDVMNKIKESIRLVYTIALHRAIRHCMYQYGGLSTFDREEGGPSKSFSFSESTQRSEGVKALSRAFSSTSNSTLLFFYVLHSKNVHRG